MTNSAYSTYQQQAAKSGATGPRRGVRHTKRGDEVDDDYDVVPEFVDLLKGAPLVTRRRAPAHGSVDLQST